MNRDNLSSRIPAWVYAVVVLGYLGSRVFQGGQLVGQGVTAYALDDAYIHLAIAKNFAFHGVWGVTPYEPVSASSSPVWVFLLAGLMKVVGNHPWLPLVLNIFSAIGLAVVIDRVIKRYIGPIGWRAIVLIAILFFLPIVTYVAIGMEHTLQLLLVAVFFAFARKMLDPGYSFTNRDAWFLFGLAALIVGVRIECAVLFPIPFIYSLVKKDFKAAGAVALGPLVAVALFAAFSATHGLSFQPNSMAIKRLTTFPGEFAAIPSDATPLERIWARITMHVGSTKELVALLLGLTMMLAVLFSERGRTASKLLIVTCLLGFVVHAANGRFGWFFRYEGYLLVFSFLTLVAVTGEGFQVLQALHWRPIAKVVCALVAVSLMPIRGLTATARTVYAMANIGHQQLQMAFFVQKFYPTASIVLNDIGAVCYYSEPHLLDDTGLATNSVTEAKLNNKWDSTVLRAEMRRRNVEIGIIYLSPIWWPGDSSDLILTGTWRIKHNVVADTSTVTFFATNPERGIKLLENLHKFDAELPPDIERHYLGD